MQDSKASWQQVLAQGFSTSSALCDYLGVPVDSDATQVEQAFQTRVPLGFAARMEKGNPSDPLLLQVLATQEELATVDGFSADPVLESNANPVPGIIHKYHGRVLFMVTGACAVNCRYCFRRHFPYHENKPGKTGWQPALDYIAADTRIHEVILSGGDPLLASNSILQALYAQLSALPHVKTIRIHSRVPVVLPERFDEDCIARLSSSRFHNVLVLHCNHPQELDDQVQALCIRLRNAGVFLLNQSVLLANVNDDPDTLIDLSRRLFVCGVMPYYLNLLDKVQGAAHFDVPLTRAHEIYQAMQAELPGYLVPKLVQEKPGEASKTISNICS